MYLMVQFSFKVANYKKIMQFVDKIVINIRQIE